MSLECVFGGGVSQNSQTAQSLCSSPVSRLLNSMSQRAPSLPLVRAVGEQRTVARRAELKNIKVPAFKIGISCFALKSFKNSKWAKIKAQRQKYHNFKELGLVIGASRSPDRRASSTLVLS